MKLQITATLHPDRSSASCILLVFCYLGAALSDSDPDSEYFINHRGKLFKFRMSHHSLGRSKWWEALAVLLHLA